MAKTIKVRIKTPVDFNEQIMSTVSVVRDGYVVMMSINSYALMVGNEWKRLLMIEDDLE